VVHIREKDAQRTARDENFRKEQQCYRTHTIT
jgi:hypothetical protein